MLKKIVLPFVALALCSFSMSSFANDNNTTTRQNLTFRDAKVHMVKIFKELDDAKTLYCGCDIIFKGRGYMPDLESCGYKIRKNEKRARRIEAEHIMPAWEFGHDMTCWKNSKRQGCSTDDQTFQLIESDLHNLYPAIGEVNADRSNYKYTETLRGSGYGKCQMVIDRRRQRALPPERSRGIVARAYLYMSEKYGVALDREHINLFNQWNNKYNVYKNECLRNKLITKVQGNDNHFVTEKCKKKHLD